MMKNKVKYVALIPVIIVAVVLSCGKKDSKEGNPDSIISGTTSILVDESLMPIVEDQVSVFESQYDAKIKLLAKSEKEAVIDFSKGVADVIILSRDLNNDEKAFFQNKKIKPKVTSFAIDAVTFVTNNKSNDTLIELKQVIDFLKGSKNEIKGLVFDNPNSSSARYLCELAGIESLPSEGVFSVNTNNEVLKFVSENNGLIGVVGLNWLTQPKPEMQKYIDELKVLRVKGVDGEYVSPSQDNIATRTYPLARVLYIINCQGYDGLGMGFASFIAGEIGQRIILQSGLAPMREPSRNIKIRNQIENKK
jgi:phosphate transport system substrate-binding protein